MKKRARVEPWRHRRCPRVSPGREAGRHCHTAASANLARASRPVTARPPTHVGDSSSLSIIQGQFKMRLPLTLGRRRGGGGRARRHPRPPLLRGRSKPMVNRRWRASRPTRPVILPCAHAFHDACLKTWWATRLEGDAQITCPICRPFGTTGRRRRTTSWRAGRAPIRPRRPWVRRRRPRGHGGVAHAGGGGGAASRDRAPPRNDLETQHPAHSSKCPGTTTTRSLEVRAASPSVGTSPPRPRRVNARFCSLLVCRNATLPH